MRHLLIYAATTNYNNKTSNIVNLWKRSRHYAFLITYHEDMMNKLCAWFEITAIGAVDERIGIKSWIENQDGDIVIEGKTVASWLGGLKK